MPEANPAIAGIDARIEQLNLQNVKIQAELKKLRTMRDQLVADGGTLPETPIENLCLGQDFSRMRPGEAIVLVLREAKRGLTRKELLEVLERTGMSLGKKSYAKKLGNLKAAVAQDPARRMIYDKDNDTISLKQGK